MIGLGFKRREEVGIYNSCAPGDFHRRVPHDKTLDPT